MNSGLRMGGLRRPKVSEDINPLEGVVNIVDAMLVFACGLMLSLIINWNVDVGGQGQNVELTQGQEMSNAPEIQKDLTESQDQGSVYQKMGTVYKDPATGKLFMLTDK